MELSSSPSVRILFVRVTTNGPKFRIQNPIRREALAGVKLKSINYLMVLPNEFFFDYVRGIVFEWDHWAYA
jgi:hypothetical protein